MTDLTYWSALVTVGLACGFLNTLASSGSAVSLPILVMLGLPEMVANATNRLPVLLGALTASWSFARRGQMDWRAAAKLVPPALIGSIGGALLAERMGNRQMGIVITGAVLIALVLIFTKVKKALSKEQDQQPERTHKRQRDDSAPSGCRHKSLCFRRKLGEQANSCALCSLSWLGRSLGELASRLRNRL